MSFKRCDSGRSRRSMHVPPPSSRLRSLLAQYARHPPRSLPLASLLAPECSPESVLSSANTLLTEVPVRLAARVHALESLPFIVGTNPFIARTLHSFRSSFETLATFSAKGPIKDLKSNWELTKILDTLVTAHANDVPTMAKG